LLLFVINGYLHMVKNNGKTLLKNILQLIISQLIILRIKTSLKLHLNGWKNGDAQELLDLVLNYLGMKTLLLNHFLILLFIWLIIQLLICFKEELWMDLKLGHLVLNQKILIMKYGTISSEKVHIQKVARFLKKI
jgi:hypothetical protein